MEAANYYAVLGSARKVAQRVGVPVRTVTYWTSTDWWGEMLAEVRRRHQDKLDGRFSGIISAMTNELEDRVLRGDVVVNPKTGEEHRKKMIGRDLCQALALLIDRRAIMRGDPNRITRSTNVEKEMAKIQKKLEDRAKGVPVKVETADEDVEALH